MELMIADMESLERQIDNLTKKAKGDKSLGGQIDLMKRVKAALDEGKPARSVELADDEKQMFEMMQLLSSKRVVYVANVLEKDVASGNEWTRKIEAMAKAHGTEAVVICAEIESQIAQLGSAEDKKEFLDSLGLEEPGLDKIIRAGYNTLGLQTYFTVGPKEARAWTIHKGDKAPQAAGVIHTDFEKGFIKAEVISFADYVAYKGEQGAKEAGKMRAEGKEYIVKDGDVLNFLFNV